MKLKHIVLLVFVLGLVWGCKDTPKNKTMQAQIEAIFPIVQGLEFDTIRNEIIAQFFDGQNYTEALFDNSTQRLVSTQHYLDYDVLPKIVRDSLESYYPSATLSQNDEIKNFDENGKLKDSFYLIELETATEFVHLEISPNGTIIRKTTQPLSEEDLMRSEEEGVEDE